MGRWKRQIIDIDGHLKKRCRKKLDEKCIQRHAHNSRQTGLKELGMKVCSYGDSKTVIKNSVKL